MENLNIWYIALDGMILKNDISFNAGGLTTDISCALENLIDIDDYGGNGCTVIVAVYPDIDDFEKNDDNYITLDTIYIPHESIYPIMRGY